ncbi:MAG: CBS domain-containing protein [Planctomycetota bacterium]
MTLSLIGTRSVITVSVDHPVRKIARMMRDMSLGSVVVLRDGRAVGIVTDRDLAVRVLAGEKPADGLRAEDVMSSPLTCIADTDEPMQAAMRMREAQVRRLPILDLEGNLAGILCLDDLLHHLSHTQHEMCEAISAFPVTHQGG